MDHAVFFCVLAVSLALNVMGQTQQSCPSSYPTECYFRNVATRTPTSAIVNKYFVIGGFFDVHEKGSTAAVCDGNFKSITMINLQAFFWGIDYYVNKYMSGKDVSVGAVVFDSCSRPDQTIENMLGYAQCKIHVQDLLSDNLVAYIGPYTNDDTRRAGMLANDLNITLISPTADAMDLNPVDQRTLLKMSPSFTYDIKAMVRFLEKVKARYVIILYTQSHMFWKAAYDELTKQIGELNSFKICIQYTQNVESITNELIDNLAKRISVKYIIPLMTKSLVTSLMTRIEQSTMPKGRMVFVLSSHFGEDRAMLTGMSVTANNTIIIDRKMPDNYGQALTDFRAHINSGSSLNGVTNQWMTDFLKQARLPDLLTTDSPMRMSVANTLMSVEAVIKGMDAAIKDCGGNSFCDKYRSMANNKNALYNQITNALAIHSPSGELVASKIKYRYLHFFVTNSAGVTVNEIGSAEVNSGNQVIATLSDLTDSSVYGYTFSEPTCPADGQCCEPPTTASTATTPTTPATNVTTDSAGKPVNNKDVQVTYPRGQEITGAYSNSDRQEFGSRVDVNHKWIIALGVLAGLGILCVIVFEIYILYKLMGTRLGHKWRTMWLGQLLLFGIFLCYLVCFAFLPVPTKATCGITRFGVGVSYSICFAVLLVKLMVILTSKTSDVLLPGDMESPNYLKGIYQFLMFIFAVGVQVVIDVQWLITVPPEAVLVTSKIGEKVWVCNHYTWEAGNNMYDMSLFVRTNFENHLLSLVYIMVMILITTILSLSAHGIITNHRESVFIGIAAGFSIPIWLAWGLIGGLNKDNDFAHEFGDGCIAFGLLITASLILFSMFLPKVRQLVNMGVEGIYLEDDRDTYYAGSVIMAPPSYRSKGPSSVIFVNNQGIYSEPVIIGNGDPSKEGVATHLRHPGSTYSAPAAYMKRPDSTYGGSRVLRVTDDLKGRHPSKKAQSEIGRPRSTKGTLPRSRSQTSLGAL